LKTYAGLGPDTLVPQLVQVAPADLHAGVPVGPEEGFVLSRVDGRTTVAEICLLVPFDPDVTVTILKRLLLIGAIDIPGGERPAAQVPAAAPETLAGLDLNAEQAQRIDAMFATLETKDAFELLEVTRAADKRALKRAYFRLSKEFHPDRFFGRNLGPYGERLSKIFQAIKTAFEILSDDARRAAYEQSRGR
jgi:hypothetical protein